MLKRFFLSLCLAGTALPLAAQNAGDQAAVWMRIPFDARLTAMGGSYAAVNGDVSALNTNPAGLSMMQGPNVALSQNFWVEGISMEHAAFGDTLNGISFGASANYINFGGFNEFTLTPSGPVANGTFTPQAMAYTVGGALAIIPELSVGISGNWAGQNLDNSWDSVVSGNAGILYHRQDGFALGASVLNAGSQLDGFDLPLQASLGASYTAKLGGSSDNQLMTAGEWDWLPNTSQSSISLGAEYQYKSVLALRVGYTFAPSDGDTTGLNGLSVGAGADFFGMELSYALQTLGSIGNSNLVSLGIKI